MRSLAQRLIVTSWPRAPREARGGVDGNWDSAPATACSSRPHTNRRTIRGCWRQCRRCRSRSVHPTSPATVPPADRGRCWAPSWESNRPMNTARQPIRLARRTPIPPHWGAGWTRRNRIASDRTPARRSSSRSYRESVAVMRSATRAESLPVACRNSRRRLRGGIHGALDAALPSHAPAFVVACSSLPMRSARGSERSDHAVTIISIPCPSAGTRRSYEIRSLGAGVMGEVSRPAYAPGQNGGHRVLPRSVRRIRLARALRARGQGPAPSSPANLRDP